MSERFEIKPSINKTGYVVIDNKKQYTFPIMSKDDCYMFCKVLNALHEKNTRLRNEIQDFQNLLTEREETFLKPIHLALDDAIENERTALGKSALKQFKQTIME